MTYADLMFLRTVSNIAFLRFRLTFTRANEVSVLSIATPKWPPEQIPPLGKMFISLTFLPQARTSEVYQN